jgi:hypothetical protein
MKIAPLFSLFAIVLIASCSSPSTPAEPAISETAARNAALKALPNSTVKNSHLETDKDRLVFSYDLIKAKTPGVFNIKINAMNGHVLSVKQISTQDEAPAPAPTPPITQ